MEVSFEAALAKAISWRVDFDEITNYTVKGNALRRFACKVALITTAEHDQSQELVDMLQTFERLCFGWLSYSTQWTILKPHPLLP